MDEHGYGIEFTLEEVGTEIGASRERVRCIEARALDKLRHPTRRGMLQPFTEPPEQYGVVMPEIPIQPHERLGYPFSPWDSGDEEHIATLMARRANALERMGLTKWDALPLHKVI